MTATPVAAGKSSFDLIDLERTLELMALEPGAHLADLACGAGRYSLALARRLRDGGRVFAVDLWSEGIAFLQEEINRLGVDNLEAEIGDVRRELPFPASSMDACLLATILHDLAPEERSSTLQEAGRLLRVGGALNIVEFKLLDDGPGPPRPKRLGEADLDDVIREHSFEKVVSGDIGPFNYLVRYRKVG